VMFRAPTRSSLRLALQICVSGTHYGLANVVEAVGRVMGHFPLQWDTAIAVLEVLDEV
jgi:hypothetical protein